MRNTFIYDNLFSPIRIHPNSTHSHSPDNPMLASRNPIHRSHWINSQSTKLCKQITSEYEVDIANQKSTYVEKWFPMNKSITNCMSHLKIPWYMGHPHNTNSRIQIPNTWGTMGTTPLGPQHNQIQNMHYAIQHNGHMATSLVHMPKQRLCIARHNNAVHETTHMLSTSKHTRCFTLVNACNKKQ